MNVQDATARALPVDPGAVVGRAGSGRRAGAPHPVRRFELGRTLTLCGSLCSSPASSTAMFPSVGRATVRCSTPRARGRVPRVADVLRPDARQHRLPGRGTAPGAQRTSTPSRATTSWSRRAARASARCVTSTPTSPSRPATSGSPTGAARWPRTDVRALRAARRRARRHRRRRPLSRTVSRTTRPATRCGCCGSATNPLRLLRDVATSSSSSCPTADQCCGFGGTFALKNSAVSGRDADRQGAARRVHRRRASCTAGDSSCLMHIGGGLTRSGPACAPCTWPRSWPRPTRRDDLPRAAIGADRAARRRHLSGDARLSRGGHATRSATRQLRRNLGRATATIRAKRAAVGRRAARLGRAAGGRRRR